MMPFVLIYFIKKYYASIQNKDPKFNPISTLFANLSASTPESLFYTAFFMLRRLMFAFNALFLNQLPVLQVYALFTTSLASIAYIIRFKPFDSPLLNRLEIFNELCLYLMSYPCLIFTDVTISEASTSTRFKYDMGWLVVTGVIVNIIVNMLVMIGLNIRMAYRVLSLKRRQYLTKKTPKTSQSQTDELSTDQIKQKEMIKVLENQVCEVSSSHIDNSQQEKGTGAFELKKPYHFQQPLTNGQVKFSIKLVKVGRDTQSAKPSNKLVNTPLNEDNQETDEEAAGIHEQLDVSHNQQLHFTSQKMLDFDQFQFNQPKIMEDIQHLDHKVVEVKEKPKISILHFFRRQKHQREQEMHNHRLNQQFETDNINNSNQDMEHQQQPLQIRRKVEHRASYDFDQIDQ